MQILARMNFLAILGIGEISNLRRGRVHPSVQCEVNGRLSVVSVRARSDFGERAFYRPAAQGPRRLHDLPKVIQLDNGVPGTGASVF